MMAQPKGQNYSAAQIRVLKEEYLDALKLSAGLITQACKKVGIGSRNTIALWRRKDPKFDAACKEAEKEACEMALDQAEGALMRNIQAGDTKAIRFYLQCKGKSRGYDLRQEIDLNATVTRPKVVFEDEDGNAVQD